MLRRRSCARAVLRAQVRTPLRDATLVTMSLGVMALAGLKPCSRLRPAVKHSLVGVAELSQKILRAFHRAPTRAHPFAFLGDPCQRSSRWRKHTSQRKLRGAPHMHAWEGGATRSRGQRVAKRARLAAQGADFGGELGNPSGTQLCAQIGLQAQLLWSSGYDASLTRWASPDRPFPGLCGACAAGG